MIKLKKNILLLSIVYKMQKKLWIIKDFLKFFFPKYVQKLLFLFAFIDFNFNNFFYEKSKTLILWVKIKFILIFSFKGFYYEPLSLACVL